METKKYFLKTACNKRLVHDMQHKSPSLYFYFLFFILFCFFSCFLCNFKVVIQSPTLK